MAHALDLVGERWSLLIVRELLEDDQLRYSDLHARLSGCGTNILAARLKTLEQGGVVRRRQLDPPAASWVYELTEYGKGLREVLHVLAHWGARSLGPPAASGDLEPGWLPGALRIALPLDTDRPDRVPDRRRDRVRGRPRDRARPDRESRRRDRRRRARASTTSWSSATSPPWRSRETPTPCVRSSQRFRACSRPLLPPRPDRPGSSTARARA